MSLQFELINWIKQTTGLWKRQNSHYIVSYDHGFGDVTSWDVTLKDLWVCCH